MKVGIALIIAAIAAAAAQAAGDQPPLLTRPAAEAIASEISGSAAKRTIQTLSQHHRIRGSDGYRAAAEAVRDRLQSYGLSDAGIISLPADGRIFYGTHRSRPAWNASFAELWEQKSEGGRWIDSRRIASWAEQPVVVAQDSVSGRVSAELVDVGQGTSPEDYRGKDVRGKLVLTSSQPGPVAALAVAQHGAAGIISWAQNQMQAWWGDDETLIRWGHLDTFAPVETFAFMVSPGQARSWQQRLSSGEPVHLRAQVEAGRTPGAYLIPTALIPGRDPSREITLSCHLDHQAPGANDNASGCSGILEVARSLSKLIAEKRLPQPLYSIRFIWPPEIEGTIALLNARPEFARRTLATIHLDMIGGNTEITKSVLRVLGSPPSSASFVGDVAAAFGHFVNDQSRTYAGTGSAGWPLVDPEGDKRALQAMIGGYNEGSDHQVWAEGSWRIPIIYIADWPDRYIHTQRDSVANIDSTKLKRAIFIAAASTWYLANLGAEQVPALLPVLREQTLDRAAATLRRANMMHADGSTAEEIANLWRAHAEQERAVLASIRRFAPVPQAMLSEAQRSGDSLRLSLSGPIPAAPAADPAFGTVYRRAPSPKGPMDGFGYSWISDQLEKARLARPALLDRAGPNEGPSFAYEALNLVDGRRNVRQIRDYLAATSGPVPVEEVAEFLNTLERLKLLEPAR
jgi:hypothetical protein